jgi:hypothetical protein
LLDAIRPMNGLLEYIGSIFVTLLPPRYRAGTTLRGPALVSGIGQIVLMLSLLALRLILFSREPDLFQQSGLSPEIVYEAAHKISEPAAYGSGIFLIVSFMFRPLNVVILYLALEGLLRAMAALVGHQVIGTLPLYAISGIHGLIDRKKYKQYIGELVPDHVVKGGEKQGYDLKVYSCRPKLNWNPYMTVEFDEVFYQYFKEEYGEAPRRFIYYLRRQHAGIPAVVIDHYRIENVMKPQPDKWAGKPGFWETAFPKWNLPPVAPDEIVRGNARLDFDLKVYSSRRKDDWNTYVTIEFEEQWYGLIKDEKGTRSHPFVYYLRKASETRPAVVIRKYVR